MDRLRVQYAQIKSENVHIHQQAAGVDLASTKIDDHLQDRVSTAAQMSLSNPSIMHGAHILCLIVLPMEVTLDRKQASIKPSLL